MGTVAFADATFTPMGVEGFFTSVVAMSADGTWVVGNAGDAFRWSDGEIEFLPGSNGLDGISDDGLTIIGDVPDINGTTTAGRWTETGGWVSIGGYPGAGSCDNNLSNGYDLSADGSIACGLGWDGCAATGFRWDEVNGMISTGSSGNASRCTAISGDGTILVGFDEDPGFGNRRAGVWTEALGWQIIGDGGPGESLGVSADGTIVVGEQGGDPFIYTQEDGMQLIGSAASATRVSDNGDVVIGFIGDFFSGFTAGIRTPRSQDMVSLQDWLISLGATGLDGWILDFTNGLSADGNTIAGTGVAPSGLVDGWVAQLTDNNHEMTLNVDPLVPGTTVMAQVSGATPNQPVSLAFSRDGAGITPLAGQGFVINLTGPRLADTTTADGNGDAILLIELPPSAAGELSLQAAQSGSPGSVSNVVVGMVQ